jgi:sulfite reductase alpha subunit-like flavoprotein
LYGSTFGTCQDLATRLLEQSKEFGFENSVLFSINDYLPKFSDLKEDNKTIFVFVVATYTGLPASSANQFSRWADSPKAKEAAKFIKFTVSLGNIML